MILCVCNGLSERDVRAAAAACRGGSVGSVYRCLGCRVQCGKCVPYVTDVAREVAAECESASRSDARPPDRLCVDVVEALLVVEAAA